MRFGKWFSCLWIVLCLFGFYMPRLSAATSLSVGDHEGTPDQFLNVPINLVGGFGMFHGQFSVIYDRQIIQVVDIKPGTIMPDYMIEYSYSERGITVAFAGAKAVSRDGELVVLRVKIAEDATVGTNVTLSLRDVTLGENSTIGHSDGSIYIIPEPLPGVFTVAIGNVAGKPNSVIRVPIQIRNADNIYSGKLTISYDNNLLMFGDLESTELTKEYILVPRRESGKIHISFAGGYPLQGTGHIALLSFLISGSVSSGRVLPLQLLDAVFDEDKIPDLMKDGAVYTTSALTLDIYPTVVCDTKTVSVKSGEFFRATFRVRNGGTLQSESGYFSPSVSSGLEIVEVNGVEIDPATQESYEVDDLILANYPPGSMIYPADGQKFLSKYQLLDAYKPYAPGEEKIVTLGIRVKEDAVGMQYIFYRAAMLLPNGVFQPDPSFDIAETFDQQGHGAYLIPVNLTGVVQEEPTPIILTLIPDPNPSELGIMSGGVGYLYYRVVDNKGVPVRDVSAAYTVNARNYSSPPTKENGTLTVPIDTTGKSPGETLEISVTHLGAEKLANPVSKRISVIPRSYRHIWGLGGSKMGKVGIAVGKNAYVKGVSEAGISYALDEVDTLTVARTAELGAGAGLGIKTPGARLTIGAVKTQILAEKYAESILYSSFSDEYVFDHRHGLEQQMAQSAILVDSAMRITGTVFPFAIWLVNAVMEHSGITYKEYRTEASVAIGLQVNAGADAFAGLEVGGFQGNNTIAGSGSSQQPVSFSLKGAADFTLGADAELIIYYEEEVPVAVGIALKQELGIGVNIGSRLGAGVKPEGIKGSVGYTKDYISANAGVDFGKSGFAGIFATLGISELMEFREEYVFGIDGKPRHFLLSIGDLKQTITFIIAGEDIASIQQSIANLVGFIDIIRDTSGGNLQIGLDAIVNELESLLQKLAGLNIAYVVTEGPVQEFRFALGFEGNLKLDVGFGFEIEGSERIEHTTLEGLLLGGKFYPQASYDDEPKSDAELSSIVDDAIKGSFEAMSRFLTQMREDVIAGTEAVVEAVATTVEESLELVKGTVKLIGTFSRDLEIAVIAWAGIPLEQTYAAPAKAMTVYQQLVSRAATPVVGGYYQFTPEGEPLAKPGELTITYTDEEIAQLGINEKSLRISYWDPDKSRWVSVGGKIDTVNNSVKAEITELHLYAITYDATPPEVSMLVPVPDSVIADTGATIQARIVDDTDQLDISSIILILDGMEVFYVFDGTFVVHTPTELSTGRHIVILKVSDLFGNMTERTWAFTVRDLQAEPWDINGDGVVDILDIVLVGNAFGKSGEGLPADVNGDDKVNIVDLVIVAMHFGETNNSNAPAMLRTPNANHIDMLEKWLREARAGDDGSEIFRRGIAVLEHLLNAIVPEETALLNNYPNPFNPETWMPYQLGEASDVSIIIYDAIGRVVKRLELGYRPAGVYRTQDRAGHWDGNNEAGESVASGIYFIVFKAGGYQKARRIVLIR